MDSVIITVNEDNDIGGQISSTLQMMRMDTIKEIL